MQGRAESRATLAARDAATASSHADAHTAPAFVLDDNYATRWAAARHLRLVFTEDVKGADISLFEWAIL